MTTINLSNQHQSLLNQSGSNRQTLPLIIIIDLDGTIIGDITPQIMSYELAKSLKNAHAKYNFDMNEFKYKLKSGLIRPYFEVFLKSIKTHFVNVEFFVYTASEKTWAEFVIKSIENVVGIKFNRPIFSRSFCINQDREYKKGMHFIRPSLLKCLKKKYNVLFNKKDLVNNILIIDNNNVYQQLDQRHLLLCPTYNYRIPENIPINIKHDVFKTHHMIINSILRKYIPSSASNDYWIFQKEFYTYYVQYLGMISKGNSKHMSDKFWLYLKDIMITQNINKFDERNIRFLNNTIRQKINMINLRGR